MPLPPEFLQAVVFDFDGLMVDTERVEADFIIEVVARWGAAVSYEDFGHLFGSVDADHEWDELVGRWCGRTGAELDREIREAVRPIKDALPLMPGVQELLSLAQQRGLLLGLASGNTLSTLQRRLGPHRAFDPFDAVVTRSEVELGKPAPDIYLEVARRLGVSPEACLALEDSLPGCHAAIAAGMQVIVCPSVVTAHCTFPDDVEIVGSLLDVAI